MRKILLIFVIGMLIYSCSSSKVIDEKIRYFDENNVEINKSKFNKIRSTNELLDITGDSINHKKLILRIKQGKVTNKSKLTLLLEKTINKKLDPTKPIVIIYYPGKDACNSGIGLTRNWIKIRYGSLEIGLKQIADVTPIYIYKDYNGLKKYEGIINWNKDPKRIIEKLFFKHHYPCSSFVVISKDGKYISRFGEFGNTLVWDATEILNN